MYTINNVGFDFSIIIIISDVCLEDKDRTFVRPISESFSKVIVGIMENVQ